MLIAWSLDAKKHYANTQQQPENQADDKEWSHSPTIRTRVQDRQVDGSGLAKAEAKNSQARHSA